MTSPSITIPFEVKRSGVLTDVIFERFSFWSAPSTIQWFRERGYTLYTRLPSDNGDVGPSSIPTVSCDDQVAASYPYAHYEATLTKQGQIPLRAWDMQGKVGFAQDLQNRHVAIKIVPAGSEEYKVLDSLQQQDLETLKEKCVIPVLDVLPIDGFSFVVMPRWGSNVQLPWPQKVCEILPIMHSMLKALNFLHKHNITHGHLTGSLLAPFLDKLTTHKLSARFTANEALQFFENKFLKLPELDQPVQAADIVRTSNEFYLQYDRWANVPPFFAQQWAHYRTPHMPQTTSLLKKIRRTVLGS